MSQELPEAVLREIQRIARLAFEAGRSSMREEAAKAFEAEGDPITAALIRSLP